MFDSLTMLPVIEARRRLTDTAIALKILRPPYPALGVGTLRVLRVRETSAAVLDIVAGYDTYERLP